MGNDKTANCVSAKIFRYIFNLSVDMICIAGADGYFKKASPSCERILGYTESELISKPYLEFVHPEDAEKTKALVEERYEADGKVLNFVNRYICKDGSYKWLEWVAAKIVGKNMFVTVARDITERKKAEEQLQTSLEEKDLLLGEVHHRVKNNLQVVSSLLNLQSRYIKDKKTLEMFKESQNRISSMALIHERLCESKDLMKIDFGRYLRGLTTAIFSSYAVKPKDISLNMDVGEIFLDLATAIPCSLILNEIISNSLKYAFPEGKKGEIRVSLCQTNKDEIKLKVSDNGVGIPKEVDLGKAKTLGLQLVATLAAEQLEGKIELDRTRGSEFKITFKKSLKKECK